MADPFFVEGFENPSPAGLPEGWTGDGRIVPEAAEGAGALYIEDTDPRRTAVVYSQRIAAEPGQVIVLGALCRTDVEDGAGAQIAVGVEEWDQPPGDSGGTQIVVRWLYCARTLDWQPNEVTFTTTSATHGLRFRILPAGGGADKTGRAWFDNVTMAIGEPDPPAVIDGFGRPVPVTEVVDEPRIFSPEEFWAKPAEASLDARVRGRSVWSYPVLRRHFLGLDLGLPKRVHDTQSALPRLETTIGVEVDFTDPTMLNVVAGDIAYEPIVHAHPAADGSYSKRYYPRRMHDWLTTDFQPAYALTEDPEFGDRMTQLLDFLAFSQYDQGGDNAFTSTYFPEEFAEAKQLGRTLEWVGAWDYVYDWEWLDAYNYFWRLHAGDHHVGAQCAAAIVRSYELTRRQSDLDAVVRFVHNQIPRYGWHTGVWEGRRYYWTEYNLSGPGNNVRDATDNVIGLVSQAVAAVGFYTGDLRKLEYARGMLWYLVREWTTDGRWYYDGAENPRNQRLAISHDMAVLLPFLWTAAYLLRAGVPLDRELEALSDAYEYYLENYPYKPMGIVRNGQLAKLPPQRVDSERWKVTTYFTANRVSSGVTVHDVLPEFEGGSNGPDRLKVSVAKLIPPSKSTGAWTLDPEATQTFTVSPAELKAGLPTGWSLQPGDAIRVSYLLRNRGSMWKGLAPATVSFTAESGEEVVVTGTVPDPAYPTLVTDESYPSYCARLTMPLGPEHESYVDI
ncbi:hypothetical protein [Flindersiella endophytica]